MSYFHRAQFLKSAAELKHLPDDGGIEVAFAGRSNAGKSSALNCLCGHKGLAKTSKTPGRTQLINLFELDEQRRLVDLPGYGYAKVPQAVKERWQQTLIQYLQKRDCLAGLVLLMDIRHPLKEQDEVMLHWAIEQQLPCHVLLTKADKLSKSQMSKTCNQIKERYIQCKDLVTIQAFSSTKRQGLDVFEAKLREWLQLK